jgi:YihY family inner membrane protein
MKPIRDLLTTPTARLGRASRFLVFQIKLWSHCVRLLDRNRAGQQAAALSYYTIFGLVPLAIVVLLVFQSLPGGQAIGVQLKNAAYQQLHLKTIEYTPDPDKPDETVMLTDYMDRIIDRFFGGLNRQSLSLISAAIVIWAAIALVSTIERVFNHIWHVPRGRGFLHRLINYWALLTLGPLLLGVGLYATTKYATLKSIETTVLTHVGPIVVSYLVAVLALFLFYFVLPNTKVQAGAALWGAAIAALVWSFAKFGFGKYVTEFIPYSKIYGVLGLIPLGVFWIHITWLIVLFGLQLTYTTQHFRTLDAAAIAAAKQPEQTHFATNDLTAINVTREIAEAFMDSRGPVSLEALCSRLDLPAELAERILRNLVDRGLLVETAEPRAGYVPARDPEDITLSDISAALAATALGQPNLDEQTTLGRLVKAQRQFLARHNLREILSRPEETPKGLSDIAGQPPAAERADTHSPDQTAHG